MRLIVLGDIHVYRLMVAPWRLISKRFMGQMNLWFHRRTRFRMERLGPLVDRVRELKPDFLLFTGDLTTTAMPEEFQMFLDRFGPLLELAPAFIVPGNHDRYTFTSARRKLFEKFIAPWSATQWPATRDLPGDCGWKLIGLDPTGPRWLTARGTLGPRQLQDLGRTLEAQPPEQPLIIACHYPIGTPDHLPPESGNHHLSDQSRLMEALAARPNPMIYLHGHMHHPWCWRPAAAPNMLAINAGAPAMGSRDFPHGQGFWEIELPKPGPGCLQAIGLTHHLPTAPDGRWQARPITPPDQPRMAAGST